MNGDKKVVLVVEDEAPMLHVLIDTLKQEGYVALQAKDGVEGLQLASSQHPDLILLDLLMPHMDGMTMMSRLRENAWGKDIPVIILTNVSADTDATLKAIVDLQPAYYLIKSDVKLEEIVEKVEEILRLQAEKK